MRLTCTQHGETYFNGKVYSYGLVDPDLTKVGKKQVQDFVDHIDGTPQAIFYSDINRCKQTVSMLIKKFPGTPAFVDWRLRERSFGQLESIRDDDLNWQLFEDTPPSESLFGIEPKILVKERVKAFMRDVSFVGISHAVVITHGGILNQLKLILDPSSFYENNVGLPSIDIEYTFDHPELRPGHAPKWRIND